MRDANSSLPVPVSPEQQHRRIGGRDALDLLEGAEHRRAFADDVADTRAVADFGSQVDVLRLQLVAKPHDFRVGRRKASSPSRRASTLANAMAKRRSRCTSSAGHARSCRSDMNPTAPTMRPATDSGTVTAERMPSWR